MSEEPEKRVVSWKEYMQTRCKKVLLNTSAVVSGCLGIYILLGVAINVIPMTTYSEYWITVITCGVGIVAVWLTTILIRKSKKIEPVQPITRHNTGDLLEVETLVRASDAPPSHQQAELLRGVATPSSETPPEELLRATLKDTNG